MTGNNSTPAEKLRAVFLAALMVGSVFAMGVAFSGTVGAVANNSVSLTAGNTVGDDVVVTATVDSNGNTVYVENDVAGEVRQNITVTDGGQNDEDGAEDGSIKVTLTAGKTYGQSPDGTVTVKNADDTSNQDSETYTVGNYLVDVTDEVTHGATQQIEGSIYEYPGDTVDSTMDWSLQYDSNLQSNDGVGSATVLADSDTGDGTFVVTRKFDEVDSGGFENDYPTDGTGFGDATDPGYVVFVNEDTASTPADDTNMGADVINARLNVAANTDPGSPTYKDTVDVIDGSVENASGGLANYQLQFKDPEGTTQKTTSSAGSDGLFSFTAETNDAGVWQIGTSEGSFIPYQDITVGAQQANLTFTASGDNLANFEESYSITLKDSEDGFALDTGAANNDPGSAQGEVQGYINVTGPFKQTQADGTDLSTGPGSIIAANNTDSDSDYEYILVETDGSGQASFDAIPVDEGMAVSASLELNDSSEGLQTGLEETDDAADSPQSPDYVATESIPLGGANAVNLIDKKVQDPQDENPVDGSGNYDADDSTGPEYTDILTDSGPDYVEVLPLARVGYTAGGPNADERLNNGERLGWDGNKDLQGMTVYRIQFELADVTNSPIQPGTNTGDLDRIAISGAGIDGVVTNDGSPTPATLQVSGDNVLDAEYVDLATDGDGETEYAILVRPTEVVEANEKINLEIDVNDETNVTWDLNSEGLNITEFKVDGDTVEEVQPNTDVNVTSIIQDATSNDDPINNGRVRITQNNTELANIDARTANVNDGEYQFTQVPVGPRGDDSDNDGIGESVSSLTFTAYQYADAGGNQILERSEVERAAVENLGIALDDSLQVNYDAENTSKYSGTNSDGDFTLTRGVEYDQIAFTLTDGEGNAVDLTQGQGQTVALNDLAYDAPNNNDPELVTLTTGSSTLSVRFDTGASDPANGYYVISDIEEGANVDTSNNGAFNNGDSFVIDSGGTLDASPQMFTLNIETPDRSMATNASETGHFVAADAQVNGDIVAAAGDNVPGSQNDDDGNGNLVGDELNHDQSDNFNYSISNVEKATIGIDRAYRVNATATDALGTPLNASDFGEVRVEAVGPNLGTDVLYQAVDSSGVSTQSNDETKITNENGTFQFDYEVEQPVNNGMLTLEFEVQAQTDTEYSTDNKPTGETYTTGAPMAQNPVVEVYDRSGADLPVDDETGNEILAKDVSNRLRVEAFPASPNDFVLPDGQAFGFDENDPKAETTAGTTTSLSDSVVTDNFTEGQVGFLSVTPTGTGDAIMHLTDTVAGSGSQVTDLKGNDVVFDVLNSNLKVDLGLSSTTVNPGEDLSVSLTQRSTGQSLPANVTVTLVGPDGTKLTSSETNESGVAVLAVEAGTASGTYTVETRPAGYEPNSEEVSVAVPEASVSIDDQSFQSSTDSLTVANATFEGGDFAVAIHNASAGSPGPIIGWANLSQGVNTDVTVSLDEEISSNVTVTAMLHESFEGATIDRGGSPVTDQANITITEENPSVGGNPPAQDPDGDGLLEDVDGNGETNLFDALTYYNNQDSAVIQDNPNLFDFDGDGTSGDLFDALALYNEISA